jgi:hypothetical protein
MSSIYHETMSELIFILVDEIMCGRHHTVASNIYKLPLLQLRREVGKTITETTS